MSHGQGEGAERVDFSLFRCFIQIQTNLRQEMLPYDGPLLHTGTLFQMWS